MNNNRRIEFTLCNVIAVIAGIIFAIAAGAGFYFGLFINIEFLLWISFGISAFTLGVILLKFIFKEDNDAKKCLNSYKLLLAGSVAAIILSILALVTVTEAAGIAAAILVALIVFFIILIIAGVICRFLCVEEDRSEPCERNDRTASNAFECLR